MQVEIAKTYDPQSFEKRIYFQWESTGTFVADATSDKKPFVISMPPPNATGQLHVGHAVMLAIEDLLTRWHRMMGDEALWVPGTDHAAIATENVVINKIRKEEGIADPKAHYGREVILEKIHQYVKDSQDTIRNQIRAIGSSCDWSRDRFTMDPQLNRCVNSVFTRMYEDGLIYRGHRIVNWDPVLQTTISDDEIEYKETEATLYFMKYGPFVVATSRPETKLGDTGIAVHPDDERYQKYVGQTIEVKWPKGPTINVKVFADPAVDPEFGSGVIGVTPAHSAVDYQFMLNHDLEMIQVIGEDGLMTDKAGSYAGMKVRDCREAFVADLQEAGLMHSTEKYIQPLSICYRSKQPIEPLPKEQWFIDVNKPVVEWKGQHRSIKEILIDVIKTGDIRIVPERFNNTYFHWIENLQDWCISRQIWWGHRVPVYYRGDEKVASVMPPQGEGWVQDEDTLDTWFSSALWTWSTLIDPELAQDFNLSFEELLSQSKDFQKFHPTQVMETGYDILFFWVARMIIMTTYAVGDIPFETVYLHGLVRTKAGKKMSKSDPDTCIDPLESIAEFGADALRLALIVGNSPGQDLRLYPEKLESCKRFVNKVWNAGRFITMTIADGVSLDAPIEVHDPVNRWILHRLNEEIRSMQRNLQSFQFAVVLENLRGFFWGDFCDWYLEMSKKPQRTTEDDHVLAYAYTTQLKLMHPLMPFVTEALWECFNQPTMLIRSQWPETVGAHHFPESEAQISRVKEAITQLRALRDKANIGMNVTINARIDSAHHASLFGAHEAMIKRLARLEALEITEEQPDVSQKGLVHYFDDTLVRIEASAADMQERIAGLKKNLKKEQDFIDKSTKKLENPNFLNKAPQAVVDELKEKVAATQKQADAYRQQIAELENS